jgi:hypothetical protein
VTSPPEKARPHVAFTSGLHAAFYASMGFMALAAALSALRAGSYPETRV